MPHQSQPEPPTTGSRANKDGVEIRPGDMPALLRQLEEQRLAAAALRDMLHDEDEPWNTTVAPSGAAE